MDINNNEYIKVSSAIKNGTASIRDWAWYYYHVRKWHVMPKKRGEKHTYLQYVKKDNKAEERYSWEFLEREFEENQHLIDGIVLKTGFVKDANCVTELDYDPRNDPTDNGKEIIDKFLQDGILITESGSGDGGVHILCEYDAELPDGRIPSTGIEIKNKALLVLPPSAHKSGRVYRFKEINNVIA